MDDDLTKEILGMQLLLTTDQVAKVLGVQVSTVRRWARERTIPVVRLPGVPGRQGIRIRRSTIEKMLEQKSTLELEP